MTYFPPPSHPSSIMCVRWKCVTMSWSRLSRGLLRSAPSPRCTTHWLRRRWIEGILVVAILKSKSTTSWRVHNRCGPVKPRTFFAGFKSGDLYSIRGIHPRIHLCVVLLLCGIHTRMQLCVAVFGIRGRHLAPWLGLHNTLAFDWGLIKFHPALSTTSQHSNTQMASFHQHIFWSVFANSVAADPRIVCTNLHSAVSDQGYN